MSYNTYLEKLEINNDIKKTLIEKGQYFGYVKDLIEEKIIEAKREYRSWLKNEYGEKYLYHGFDGKGYGEIVGSHWELDGGYKKIFFPGECWTEEEKKEFVEENWTHYKWSPYDCTGQLFTWAIDVFNVPSGVVAYIREAIDC